MYVWLNFLCGHAHNRKKQICSSVASNPSEFFLYKILSLKGPNIYIYMSKTVGLSDIELGGLVDEIALGNWAPNLTIGKERNIL